MTIKYVLFKREARHGKVVKSLKPLPNKVNVPMQRLPLFGKGLLSGSFPLSLITQGGNLPSQSDIRILYRPEQGASGDGYVVATTTCNADGTWQVSGLNENLKFDIVARIPGFNDVIISNVQPMGAPLSAHFANLKEEYEYQEEVNIQVVALGGRPPYTYEAITLPNGLSLSSTGYITGIMLGTLELTFEIKVTDSEGSVINLANNSYVAGDPHWDKVVSLLHFDEVDGTQTFSDATGKTWTAHGNAQIDTAQSKFGGASLLLDGNGDYATTPNSADFDLGNGDFTIEAWVRRNGTGVIVGKWRGSTASACSFLMEINGSGKLGVSIATNTTSPTAYSSAITVPSVAWVHVAVVRSGTALWLFIDGVKDANTYTLNGSINYYTPEPLSIGAVEIGSGVPKAYFNGRIDELRITKGVARYTKNFTPPTKSFLNF